MNRVLHHSAIDMHSFLIDDRSCPPGRFEARADSARRWPLVILIVVAVTVVSPGCYHYRVVVPDSNPATDYESRVAHSFFWGLMQEDVTASDCLSNAIDEVRVTTNLFYSVISTATLGIWMPMRVQWRCAKEPMRVEEL